jgi:hypothetical protein
VFVDSSLYFFCAVFDVSRWLLIVFAVVPVAKTRGSFVTSVACFCDGGLELYDLCSS